MEFNQLVEEWDKGSRDDKGNTISLRIISKFNSFQKYACSDNTKKRLISTHAGSKTALLE